MARVALTLALVFLGAMATALPAADPIPGFSLSVTIPKIDEVTFQGITFSAEDITITLTSPSFSVDYSTTNKYVSIDNTAFGIKVGHYKLAGEVASFDISGDGTMDLELTEHIINQASYTSTAADSFCAVDGSVKVFFQTHAAKLDITGMKDESVEQLFMSYVNSNGATIGTTIGTLINTKYGGDINKFIVPALNAICKDL